MSGIPSIGSRRIPIHKPKTTTNIITNGGFETDETGWTTAGTNVRARSLEQAHSGAASLKCTYNDTLLLAQFVPTITDNEYIMSAWVYIPTNWDGGSITIDGNGYTNSVQNSVASNATRDAWQRITCSFNPDAADLVGTIRIRTASAATAGRFIYIDDIQVELGLIATPYVATDGEIETRAGSKWLG